MGSSGEGQAFVKILEMATISCVPMALKAAIKLNVMDILAEHGGEDHFLSATQIASHFESPLAPSTSLQTASASLDRILRVLASHGFLSSSLIPPTPHHEEPIRTYALNSISHFLVQTKGPGSLAPHVLLIQDPIFMQTLYDLHESVLDGLEPFAKIYGMNIFSYMQHDARFNNLLNSAMASHTELFMHSLLETYNGFQDITSLVDVGGGTGACIGIITSKHPHIKGINFDQDHVIMEAPQYSGVEHVGGDMFKSIPKADAIFMKRILHDWSDDHCLKILGNCYNALPNKGKVIVVDAILSDKVEHDLNAHYGCQMDLLMMTYSQGGKQRTITELENISKATKFSRLEVICNTHAFGIVEIYKN